MMNKDTKVVIRVGISQILIALGCFLTFHFESPYLSWLGLAFNMLGCGYGQVIVFKLMGYSFRRSTRGQR